MHVCRVQLAGTVWRGVFHQGVVESAQLARIRLWAMELTLAAFPALQVFTAPAQTSQNLLHFLDSILPLYITPASRTPSVRSQVYIRTPFLSHSLLAST
jgi:hypothetical protein